MSEPIVWENIPKSQSDPQTIGEAIAEGVNVHNEDIEAHMAELQSLEAHRTNNIVDHPAESVVNDKLAARSRAYIAIVDPESESDYDSIAAAIEYAHDNGGGNVLISPGEHYIVGNTTLYNDVNLYGVDRDTCIVHTGATSDDLLVFDWSTPIAKSSQIIEGLTFVNGGEGVFTGVGDPVTQSSDLYVRECTFSGYYTHFLRTPEYTNFIHCLMRYGADGGILASSTVRLYDTDCMPSTVNTPHVCIGFDYVTGGETFLELYRCYVAGRSGYNNTLFVGAPISGLEIYDSDILYWTGNSAGSGLNKLLNNLITLSSSGYVEFDIPGAICNFNAIVGGSGNKIRLTSLANECRILFNFIDTLITNSGSANVILWNGVSSFTVLASSATAMSLGLNNMVQLTPNSTRTLTTTVPPAGTERIIKILTSGSTSYTLTFGSGFKSTGTLATGATSSRIFIIRFVSDGTNLIETSRTGAIVA